MSIPCTEIFSHISRRRNSNRILAFFSHLFRLLFLPENVLFGNAAKIDSSKEEFHFDAIYIYFVGTNAILTTSVQRPCDDRDTDPVEAAFVAATELVCKQVPPWCNC